jgi:hypothetical protein
MSRKDPVRRDDPQHDREPAGAAPRETRSPAEELARKSPETLAELQRRMALERLVAEMD